MMEPAAEWLVEWTSGAGFVLGVAMTGTPSVERLLGAPPAAFQPSAEDLQELAARSPRVRWTRNGSLNVRTRVTARSRRSTFLVSDGRHRLPGPTILRVEGDRLAAMQDAHLSDLGSVVVDGFLGAPGPLRMGVRIVTESGTASLAAMHRALLFDPVTDPDFVPDLTVVTTPTLSVPGAPDGCMIAVWTDEGVTRIIGTDFFGETKKAATRMWGERVFDAGGLVLHAGCIVVPTELGPATVVVMGPPDSGKSTLVMQDPATVRVVQDDFVALLPHGRLVPAENGCIEKTWQLSPHRQPVLFAAANRPEALLENVPQRDGELLFADPRAPRHARAVFPLECIGGAAEEPVPDVRLLVVFDPGEEITPAVQRIDRSHMPGHFLLRERLDGLVEKTGRHGNRLAELLATCAAEVVVLNTATAGRDAPGAVRKGAAEIVTAIARDSMSWTHDPGMRCAVATSLPGDIDPSAAWPRRAYELRGALHEYDAKVEALRAQWRDYLSEFVGLDPSIVAAVT